MVSVNFWGKIFLLNLRKVIYDSDVEFYDEFKYEFKIILSITVFKLFDFKYRKFMHLKIFQCLKSNNLKTVTVKIILISYLNSSQNSTSESSITCNKLSKKKF